MRKVVYVGNRLNKTGKTITSIETLGRLLANEGFDMVLTSSKKNKLHRLIDMLLTVYRNRKSADYVLIDTYSTLNFYYAFLVSKLCIRFKVPYIPILRGGDLPNRLAKSPKKCNTIFDNALMSIAPSEYLNSAFKEAGYTKVMFIPNNIEVDLYEYKEREGIKPNLLWVRSFRDIYNPTLAIEVLQLLKENYPEAKLCMIGPQADKSFEETKSLATKYDLLDSIEFTGMLTKEAWREKSVSSSIFINTTNFDNTPISLIEAMALGLPVVSTNVGGIPFLISDQKDGILVKKSDALEMKQAIIELIDNPKRANKIALNARNKVENFDWKIIKKKWLEVLK
ncbi:MAG: glycosyltransferase family 4 protein [Flavobacteriaceae bacterium]|nr:glycosyltransferase family 4 protein [Flavobacteriaceae bacterium]